MTVEAFRIQNFMGFEDSGWIELRPITLLFGRNSVGKSAILRAMLLLRQSLDSPPEMGPFLFVKDDGFDFGNFRGLVRDHRIDRSISFWFQCRLKDKDDDPWQTRGALRGLGAVGEVVRVRLTYRQPTREKKLSLSAVDLYDGIGGLILQASAPLKQGAAQWIFSSEFFNPYDTDNYDLWSALELFTSSDFLPRVRSTDGQLTKPDENFGDPFHYSSRILRGISRIIGASLASLEYLGPLREEPQRFYYVSGQASGLAARGKHFVRNLLNANPSLVKEVNDWLIGSGFGVRLELKPLDAGKTLYELRLADAGEGRTRRFSTSIREVGFGLSQALPVIVQTLLAPDDATVLIEQPELHLHPGAQAELGDLLIKATAENRMRILAETHSEHLILRLQRRIRLGMLVPGRVNVVFVTKRAGISTCHSLRLDSQGDFIDEWPEGFFNERFSEIFGTDESDRFLRNK